MILLWNYYWGLFAAAVAVGVLTGWRGFGPLRLVGHEARADAATRQKIRLRHRNRMLFAGAIVSVLLAAAVHNAAGQGDRFTARVEQDARRVLDHYEMQAVDARLARAPLRRELRLSGAADDFQRGELVRMFAHLDGIQAARWAAPGAVDSPLRFPLPLLAEIVLLALASFALGLVVAYLIELRRRARREENYRGARE